MAREWQPELIVGVVEAAGVTAEILRCDAHDHVVGLIDLDAPSDDVGIAVEADLPDPMTNHGFRFRTRRVIHLGETRSARQRHADGREVIARHVHRRHRNPGTFVVGLVEAVIAGPAAHGHAAGGVAHIEVVGE
jgi:hypothetical protein